MTTFKHASIALAALALIMSQAHAQNPYTPSTPQGMTQSGAVMENVPSTATPSMTPTGTTSDSYRNNWQTLPNEPTNAGNSSGNHESWIPYTSAGYVGLSVGKGTLNTDCVAGQSCGNPNSAFTFYTGGMFSPNGGVQLGYLQLQNASRNGGKTEVKGLNLTLVGALPLSPSFSLLGRLGGTYGWTTTSIGTGVPAPAGKAKGVGAAYGVGASWNFNPNWSLTVDWDRHHLKYAGNVKRDTDVAALGVKYNF